MEFNHAIFGGELTLSTFKEYLFSQDPSEDNKIMHAMLESEFVTIMAADVPNSKPYQAWTKYLLVVDR